jgi:hypothetical protein
MNPKETNDSKEMNPQQKSLNTLAVRMGKCAEDIGRTSAEIISSTLRLHIESSSVGESRDRNGNKIK